MYNALDIEEYLDSPIGNIVCYDENEAVTRAGPVTVSVARDGRIGLHFPYSEEANEVVKSAGARFFRANGRGCWLMPRDLDLVRDVVDEVKSALHVHEAPEMVM